MYSSNQSLGAAPPPAQQGKTLLDSLFGIVKGGYDIFAGREQSKRAADIEKEKIRASVEMARIGVQPSSRPATGPSYYQGTNTGTDWAIPALVGIGVLGIGAFVFMKKK